MHAFDYAVVRVVPRVERGEQINAGIIIHCKTAGFLDAALAFDRQRLAALDPDADADAVERALALIPLVCSGDARAGAIGKLPQAERFGWLTSPRSTVVQTSPVHSGLTDDLAGTLDDLMRKLVLPLR
jgi:DUF3037 family protein